MNMLEENHTSITEEYEQKVLEAFKAWYQQHQPTINEASTQAYLIARDTVRGLTASHVILLLQEHAEWTHKPPPETYDSDRCLTIGEAARRHFVKYLEKTIQRKGLQAAYISAGRVNTRKESAS